MDKMILLRKMESLHRCIQRIHSKKAFDNGTLLQDYDFQDILSVKYLFCKYFIYCYCIFTNHNASVKRAAR